VTAAPPPAGRDPMQGATRLLVLALACQASISIVQWGLGVIAPDLQARYDLSAASLGALVNATALGNAVALMVAGVIVDRSGPRKPLLYAGSACGGLLVVGALLTNPVGLGVALFASGVAGALVAVGATVSVFHGFPPERRGFALGMRQMSVALGGLLAALLLPLAVHLGGVRLALGLSGVLTAATAIVFALDTPHGPLVARNDARRVVAPFAVLREPGMGTLLVVALCYITALDAVLTFAVPALRDGGASRGEGSLLFAFISLSAMAARIGWGRLADSGGGRRRISTLRDVGVLGSAAGLATWLLWPEGTALRIAALVVLSLGALGFNGILYLIAGEMAGAARAGQAVALMSTALFGGGALAAVPLGALADAEGYRSLWLAAAIACGLGVIATLRLHPATGRRPLPG
jgi:MFS family permease